MSFFSLVVATAPTGDDSFERKAEPVAKPRRSPSDPFPDSKEARAFAHIV